MTRIQELLDLPEQVRKGDFVLSLARGIEHPEETVRDYAITPNLVQAFGRTLSMIDSGLRDSRSQAAYLHGSFGSGKSHFMAMLDLMLSGHSAPWRRSELHPLRDRYEWIGNARLLQLPLHMIGAESLEQKIFDAYVRWSREHHPEAPVPALFGDQELFDNAQAMRTELGDVRFFERLNQGDNLETAGWGALANTYQWTAERFEQAIESADPEERGKLFSALVKTFFSAFANQSSHYIDLDRGLGVLSRHAASLGYQGIVLYLDELILWLASSFGDLSFVQREAQKIAKLKEAQDEGREIPLFSFIARQRDLSELVGDDVIGEQHTILRDSLAWSSGRFETIVLEDRNLPAVVERRVLRPKDEESEQRIKDGFVKIRKSLQRDWATLLGSYAEAEDFGKVYPFSPALVEALVALSDCLQRERTAIRILMELLVEHQTELKLGQVVPVGDIFDVIAGGEDAFDSVMRDRFERAKHLYRHKLLELIHAEHGTGTASACQRLRDDHPVRLGCSGCPNQACRNDNRLAKTLLLAALVPEAGPFKDMTVKRLVALNHGAITSPIPGTEFNIAVQKLRKWAAQEGKLQVGDQADPIVFLRLEGVDLKPILDSAQQADNFGARKRLLQSILFTALGLPTDASQIPYSVEWWGTRRNGKVRFGNVRELSDQALNCPDDAEFFLVIDYPFDDPGHSPEDDLRRLERYREKSTRTTNPVLIWLPHFFSEKMEREVGQLAILDHILTGDNPRRYLGQLRPENQTRARLELENRRSQTHAQIREALKQAYGITAARKDEYLDSSRRVDQHILSLQPGLEGQPLLAGDFEDGLRQLAVRLLEHRYPHHPRFGAKVTPNVLGKTLELLELTLDAPQGRLVVDGSDRRNLSHFADPLGLVRLGENSAQLNEARLRSIQQQQQRAGATQPTVREVREYVDPNNNMGLPREASDLMVQLYALWSGHTLEYHGNHYEPSRLGQIHEQVELVKPELPTDTEWDQAMTKASSLFGISIRGRALTARNLRAFSDAVEAAVKKLASALELPKALKQRLEEWGKVLPEPPRLQTAYAGQVLLQSLQTATDVGRVRILAEVTPQTSAQALARSMATASQVLPLLKEKERWLNFAALHSLYNQEVFQARAQEILEALSAALAEDQLNTPLESRLSEFLGQASDLLRQASQLTKTPKVSKSPERSQASERLQELFAKELSPGTIAQARTLLKELLQRLELVGEDRQEDTRIWLQISAHIGHEGGE